MKVLMVEHSLLDSKGGGSFAAKAYANAFAALAENMALVYPVRDVETVYGIDPRIKLIPRRKTGSWLRRVARVLLTGNMYDFSIGNLLKTGCYDTVVFNFSPPAIREIDKARRFGCRIITVHHNYQFQYSKDNFKGSKKLLLPWIRKAERDCVVKSSLSITLTAFDKETLYNVYDPGRKKPIEVGGTFLLDADGLSSASEYDLQTKEGFIITGSLVSPQSLIPLTKWIREYYPIVRELYPNSKVTIAGKNPPQDFISLCNENQITIVPSPANMDEYLHDKACYICPIDAGSGIKLRVLDGLKFGMPVIAHEVSTKGYEMFLGKYVFLYNDKASFTEAVKRVSSSTFDAEMIRQQCIREFSFSSGVERLSRILNKYGLL